MNSVGAQRREDVVCETSILCVKRSSIHVFWLVLVKKAAVVSSRRQQVHVSAIVVCLWGACVCQCRVFVGCMCLLRSCVCGLQLPSN